MKILVDSREQAPFTFVDYEARTEPAALAQIEAELIRQKLIEP